MRFVLSLQTIDQAQDKAWDDIILVSSYSVSLCVSTTSASIC